MFTISVDINPLFIVNQTDCTKIMFDFWLIHFIHINPQFPCWNLSTWNMPILLDKSSYTPSYPHYPQFYPRENYHFPGISQLFYFCTHFIKFQFATSFSTKTIDKSRTLSQPLYRFNTLLLFLNCRKSFGYQLFFTDLYAIIKPS